MNSVVYVRTYVRTCPRTYVYTLARQTARQAICTLHRRCGSERSRSQRSLALPTPRDALWAGRASSVAAERGRDSVWSRRARGVGRAPVIDLGLDWWLSIVSPVFGHQPEP